MSGAVADMTKERELPETIDYYVILEDGTVSSNAPNVADVYISEFDVQYLSNKKVMLQIRQTYGPHIGVMRDVDYSIYAREYRTPKMLLGLIRGVPADK